jgi:hypothetical protein
VSAGDRFGIVFKFTEDPKRYMLVLGDGELQVEFAAKTSLVALFAAHGIVDGFGFDLDDCRLFDADGNETPLLEPAGRQADSAAD